ncbi:MAG: MgtC/SapB family protein [Corynebacteriales bacterium]|uniref:MgtC/SapB family protein n=1 Tax=Williamsia herbipolensis TaxID=1603258 RepID=A0AAU4JYZ8_9NOCA|nr:MgtC/SapB family protein [Williamsia herbipolensis]MCX6471933.1 MgtC/SapB family protein [Mycobacteriales bacterium]
MSVIEMILRLACGVGLGTIIGFERQYRARMAGLRTNALVAAGSTLFVLLSAHGFSGGTADPTRVAAQIVSGIGFLGAGVILRDGLNVRGLNTAATLWCSAAVGALSGAGLYSVALAGTVAVVTVNVVLRWIGRTVDRHPDSGDEQPTSYAMTVATERANAVGLRAALVGELSSTDAQLRSVTTTDMAGSPSRVEIRAVVDYAHRGDRHMVSALHRMSGDESVSDVRWDCLTDEAGAGVRR